jgi:hypothetical protein
MEMIPDSSMVEHSALDRMLRHAKQKSVTGKLFKVELFSLKVNDPDSRSHLRVINEWGIGYNRAREELPLN